MWMLVSKQNSHQQPANFINLLCSIRLWTFIVF